MAAGSATVQRRLRAGRRRPGDPVVQRLGRARRGARRSGVEPDVVRARPAGSSSTSGSARDPRRTSRPTCPTTTCASTRSTRHDPLVVKVGGAVAAVAAADHPSLATCRKVVVVHGAGPQISVRDAAAGLPVDVRRRPARDDHGRRSRSCASRSRRSTRPCARRSARARSRLFGRRDRPRSAADPGARARRRPGAEPPGARSRRPRRGPDPRRRPAREGPLNVNADEAAVGARDRPRGRADPLPHGRARAAARRRTSSRRSTPARPSGCSTTATLEGGIVPKLQAAVRAAKLGVRAEIGETAVLA